MNKYEAFSKLLVQSLNDSFNNFSNKKNFDEKFIEGYELAAQITFDLMKESANAHEVNLEDLGIK